MIEGTVETLSAEGVFQGWLRDTRDPVPALVQIRLGDDIVAEALASAFRPDLLRGGHGHGHYGFLARARVSLTPGPALFALFLPRHGQGIPVRLTVPALAPQVCRPVESLLEPEPAWSVADLAAAIPCLHLPSQRRAMGTLRFVDACFQFVLQRWPLDEEAAVYAHALEDGSAGPDRVFAELLSSRERADLGEALPSPWDAAFPFVLGKPGAPAFAKPNVPAKQRA